MGKQADLLLQIVDVEKTYKRGTQLTKVLNRIHISVPCGAFIALKGRSGSGKTTLLNLICGLDQPTAGSIWFNGETLSEQTAARRDAIRRMNMGLVFQTSALIPYMTAYENIEFALRILHKPQAIRHSIVMQSLEQVGLQSRKDHRPYELSGGEQQRIAIARAMAIQPKLILADEPTAELDSRTGLRMIRLFRELVAQSGVTILLTTHDPAVMELVDSVYELEDGYIVQHIENQIN